MTQLLSANRSRTHKNLNRMSKVVDAAYGRELPTLEPNRVKEEKEAGAYQL